MTYGQDFCKMSARQVKKLPPRACPCNDGLQGGSRVLPGEVALGLAKDTCNHPYPAHVDVRDRRHDCAIRI